MAKKKNEVETKNNVKDNIQEIEKEIMSKKQFPKEELEKINSKVFENIFIANIIMLFLYLISLGSLNIETQVFVTDLKVFSIGLVILSIVLFEYSYNKENGNICIHGIECLFLAIFILFSIYLYVMDVKRFYLIASSASFVFAIYYVGKSILIDRRMRKAYIKSINDINEIIKK